MALVELVMPKMGESIVEATILKWVKNVGDAVEADETILEIATDKVDSEVPSPSAGVITEIRFQEDDVVEVGKVLAIISTDGQMPADATTPTAQPEAPANNNGHVTEKVNVAPPPPPVATPMVNRPVAQPVLAGTGTDRFYSPLVKNIAQKENISHQELEAIPGTGLNGRVTKKDILGYVSHRGANGSNGVHTAAPVVQQVATTNQVAAQVQAPVPQKEEKKNTAAPIAEGNVEIIEMDRMRKLIAKHMVNSKHTSPHVTSFVEADVTNIVNWRNSVKGDFQKKHGEKITFTPIFMEAVVKALADYPMVNVSVSGDHIIVKKDINIGMATALPNGNLIVPVIKHADRMNLMGLTKSVNELAANARNNKLSPEQIQGGTFTLTNVGTFGNVMGTPIINQPQVAILAVGAIRKRPAVLETEHGDVIAVRQMMFLSLSYDHRVVDGFLGGSFLKRVADYLEGFDHTREI